MWTLCCRVVFVLFVSAAAVPGRAEATYDMSGKWLTVPADSFHSRLDLIQSGVNLSQRPAPSTLNWTGTIDEGTGSFHLQAQNFHFLCSESKLDGTVAADGKTFVGTLVHPVEVASGSYEDCENRITPVIGTRCGNNEIDTDEECDFGDAADGDCCTSFCLLEPEGAGCTSDGTQCTSDVCDAAGACQHLPVPGGCVESHGCGTGDCSDGACVISAPAPQGTACESDANVCTSDACDGAGICAAGEWISCWPCRTCDSTRGCVPESYPCTEFADLVRLSIQSSPRTRQNRFKLEFGHSLLYYIGNPTDDTHYAVCLYADDGAVVRPLFTAVIPPGGQCDGEDCWRDRGGKYFDRFTYKDQSRAADGVYAVSVKDGGGIKVKGSGANLSLPSALPTSGRVISTILAVESAAFAHGGMRCWSHAVTGDVQTPSIFRGEYHEAP